MFVSGTFNIVHPRGHLRLLRFAAECGDYLVVGVLDDRLATNAQLDQGMRLEGVAAISWVDHAFVLHDAPHDFSKLRPAVVAKGKEHESGTIRNSPWFSHTGKSAVRLRGYDISSLDLIRKETELINHSSIIRPKEFIERHGISISGLKSVLEKNAIAQGLRYR